MIVTSTSAVTPSLRQLCQDIENECQLQMTFLSDKHKNSPSLSSKVNPSYVQQIEQLKNRIVKVIASTLPVVINFQERINQKIQDLIQQRDDWHTKYKRIFQQFEENQLQNDKMKIQIINLSQNYEALSISFEQMKYSYHQLKQQQHSIQLQTRNQEKLKEQLHFLNKDSRSVSGNQSDRDHIRVQNQVMAYQKELFLQEIKQTQRQLLQHKNSIEVLLQQKQKLQQENRQYQNLLTAQKARIDRLDKQLIEVLNKNQEYKLQILQEKQRKMQEQQASKLKDKVIQQQRQKILIFQNQKNVLNREIIDLTTSVNQLKLLNSQQRQKNDQSIDREKHLKVKIAEMAKENEQVRKQIERMAAKIDEQQTLIRHYEIVQRGDYEKKLKEVQVDREAHQKQSKDKSTKKMQQIASMHRDITQKLTQKITLLEKSNKEKKDKITSLKFQIERLYQSLQVQVDKQFKNSQQIKQLTQKTTQLQNTNIRLEAQLQKSNNHLEVKTQNLGQSKMRVGQLNKKLSRKQEVETRLRKLVLPKLKEELYSIKLSFKHLSSMVHLQQEQFKFILQKKEQNIKQILQQRTIQSKIFQQQSQKIREDDMNRWKQDINKWKQNCRNYQDRYVQMKQQSQIMQQRQNKKEEEYQEIINKKQQKISILSMQAQKNRMEQKTTAQTIQQLKEKCKQIQQYYKLVQQLSKENQVLKSKVQNQVFSFNAMERVDLQHTRKNKKSNCVGCQKSNNKTPQNRTCDSNLTDLTRKAQCQRVRLQEVKRQYDMVNGDRRG